jgi:KaiC/GvpD/RAD55 family RecA-like ATPase
LAKRSKVVDFEIPLKGEPHTSSLPEVPTGIKGLDEISSGGLPRGRTTVVCGGPGCGKTMLGMEFLIRGAQDLNGERNRCVYILKSRGMPHSNQVRDLSNRNEVLLGLDLKE